MSRIDALLVDLDGTLADSHAALRACFEGFLARRGLTPDPAEFDALDGVRLADIPARLRERFAIDEPLEELRREYEQSVAEAYATVAPAPGAAELAREAGAARIALVLVTSAPRAIADVFLRSARLAGAFTAVVSAEDGPGKPDPAVFERALEAAGVEAARALAVEDAPAGVRAACAAGVEVLGVTSDASRASVLRQAGARDVAPDLNSVAQALRRSP